jgi:hypothetical protein
MAIKYYKWSLNKPIFTIQRPSKIYPKLDFWFENKPSGNPASETNAAIKLSTIKKDASTLTQVCQMIYFKPKVPIWVNFEVSYNERCW